MLNLQLAAVLLEVVPSKPQVPGAQNKCEGGRLYSSNMLIVNNGLCLLVH